MAQKAPVTLNKYSFGVGDRFAHQARAQLSAIMKARDEGVLITPVWNKSFREHTTIKSQPSETREQADSAVKSLGWNNTYFVDADHVGMNTVDYFLEYSDFFTLDVADFIGKRASEIDMQQFIEDNKRYLGNLEVPGIEEKFNIDQAQIEVIAQKYLFAAQEAGRIYRKILEKKNHESFVVEVSMDETDLPQSPMEIFFILSALSKEKIPVQTLAPKFSGRFNKGVDYVGDLKLFKKEFTQDVAILQFAIKEFSFPESLKLSVHSGSDKFSIYPVMKEVLREYNCGLHIKTAGTTWLEELIGLAQAGGAGLDMAKDIYAQSVNRFDELCKPYSTVIDINIEMLPSLDKVQKWDGDTFAHTLRHNPAEKAYNPHFRQLLHVGYKIAAERKSKYFAVLEQYEAVIAQNVTENIYQRHIKPLFM
jgi:hypothetical protein